LKDDRYRKGNFIRSASYESWRAMPLQVLGEAAGTAAAICVKTKKYPGEVMLNLSGISLLSRSRNWSKQEKLTFLNIQIPSEEQMK